MMNMLDQVDSGYIFAKVMNARTTYIFSAWVVVTRMFKDHISLIAVIQPKIGKDRTRQAETFRLFTAAPSSLVLRAAELPTAATLQIREVQNDRNRDWEFGYMSSILSRI